MRLRPLILALSLCLLSAGAGAYDIVMDIDHDGDPGTLRTSSELSRVVVKLVLTPTMADEWISNITFALGGTCWECWQFDVPYTYGTDCELYWQIYDWLDMNPLFEESWADFSLCLGCCNGNGSGDGFHLIYSAVAAAGGFSLDEPIFLREFEAWVAEGHQFDHCPHPPSNLITFTSAFGGPGSQGNEIQIGEEFVPAEESSWSLVKSLY